ncbi:hypothetical protein ABY44_23670 [Burkholderia sp. ZZQ-2]|uniref:hypothetical protein n=1 Tax=Burkholderia sp. ZZQ-2 TaxID=1661766 RepID=UPI003D6F824A
MTRPLYLFWGGLDLLYLIRFLWLNFADGRIPLYHDIQAFGQLHEPGDHAAVWLGLSLLLTVSIAVSACLFLRGGRWPMPRCRCACSWRCHLCHSFHGYCTWARDQACRSTSGCCWYPRC